MNGYPRIGSESRILDGYYSDSPIESSSDDAFGRDPFAARMAFVIDQMGTQSRSSVAALVGPWGSGKSSILNLLTDHLKLRLQDGGFDASIRGCLGISTLFSLTISAS